MEILRTEALYKSYQQGDVLVRALDGVNISIDKGDFVAIVGPSGSGKSTLMHMLGGVDRPSSGRVIIAGRDITQLNEDNLAIFRRRQVGLIYQFYNLIPILNVEETLKLPLLLDGQKVDEEHFIELTHYLGLEDRLQHLPSQLSGGQQQRVSIGRALIYHPAIILADEPTGNLDQENSAEIVRLLKESNEKLQQTVIVITHDQRIAMQSKRVLTMSDGKIVRDERVRR